MKKVVLILLTISYVYAAAQTGFTTRGAIPEGSVNAVEEIMKFQQELNDEYQDSEESPLNDEVAEDFEGHQFFPIDLTYRVKAKLTITEGTPFFEMKTNTSRMVTERVFGYVTFELAGQSFRIPVYQSKDLMNSKEYADNLFFPFADETNGTQTYAGGRYIDLRIPTGDTLIIDFNQAYNPYCAYSPLYSCPLVPPENVLPIPIPAGVMIGKYFGPKFPGGKEAYYRFLMENVTYPKSAEKKRIEGNVFVEFVIDETGAVKEVKTIKGLSEDCDREAERVIALTSGWAPALSNGEKVRFRLVQIFSFSNKGKNKKR